MRYGMWQGKKYEDMSRDELHQSLDEVIQKYFDIKEKQWEVQGPTVAEMRSLLENYRHAIYSTQKLMSGKIVDRISDGHLLLMMARIDQMAEEVKRLDTVLAKLE